MAVGRRQEPERQLGELKGHPVRFGVRAPGQQREPCGGGWSAIVFATSRTFASGRAGHSPFFGGTNLLALTIGEKKTREVVYMCKQYTAQEALTLGMVNKVVPHEKLYDEVQEWCENLLDRSPLYLEMSKVGANCWFDMLMPSFEMAKQAMTQVAGNAQQTEGATAFMEKRKPNFRKFRKAD